MISRYKTLFDYLLSFAFLRIRYQTDLTTSLIEWTEERKIMAKASATMQTDSDRGGCASLDQRLMELKEAVQQRKLELKNETLAYRLSKSDSSREKLESFLRLLHDNRKNAADVMMCCQQKLNNEPSRSSYCIDYPILNSEQKEEEKEDSSAQLVGTAPQDTVTSALEEFTSMVQTSLVCQSTVVYKILVEARILQTADTSHIQKDQSYTGLLTRQVCDLYKAVSAQSDTKELQNLKHKQESSLVSYIQGMKAMNAHYSSFLGEETDSVRHKHSKATTGGPNESKKSTLDKGDIQKMHHHLPKQETEQREHRLKVTTTGVSPADGQESPAVPRLRPNRKLRAAMEDLTFVSEVSVA